MHVTQSGKVDKSKRGGQIKASTGLRRLQLRPPDVKLKMAIGSEASVLNKNILKIKK